ncbi:caspase family protein [Flavilitoribacter nigricans]|uniref:Caspase family protein n=1 Tax=Flavilitoribacter nigricans (strain ATCC 23147 / DSM 23189 / NBRC 102662 / NCIMB 1420 / SS-2) TaxID=1122177 RepID=A0A2D0NAY0_FLAN2|nr:caspase family protein [Flavilitoribacter nigricans]PHN05664.1 hypothetical protein CRP01_14370 [Flavilitoribacter nigricans DSM 23189 = NBRC 102662]
MANKGIGLDPGQLSYVRGQTHLLVIAIDAYRHCPPLYNCVKDARDLITVLTEKYGVLPENTTTLFNEAATRDNIYEAFEKMVSEVHAPDNLLIYFSGHGEYNKSFQQGYWIPVNAEQGRTSQYIPNSEIRIFLSAIPAHHIFLMADSCFSGSLFAQGADRFMSKRYESDPSRWGLTSGRNEIVSDGKPGDNSPFAESLLYRLRQNSGAIGVQELCAQVVEYVQSNADQSPIGEPLKISGHKNGQFVFHLLKNAKRDWASTRQTDTLEAYQAYLSTYPDSENSAAAKDKIRELQEIKDWEQVKTEHTIFSYSRYLSKYTDGQFEEEARLALRRLEDDQSWERARKQGTLSAMYDYLDKHPDGQYIAVAKKHIASLIEDQRKTGDTPTERKPAPASRTIAPTKTASAETGPKQKKKEPTTTSGLTTQLKAIGGGILLILLFFIGKQITKLGSGNNQKAKEPTSQEATREDNGKIDLTTDLSNFGNKEENPGGTAPAERAGPRAVVSLAGFRGQVNLQNIKSNPELVIHCRFTDCQCTVKSFTLTQVSGARDGQIVYNTGGKLNDRSRQLLSIGSPGDLYYFSDIRVACNDNLQTKTVGDFSVKLSRVLSGLKIKSIPLTAIIGLPGLRPGPVDGKAFIEKLGLAAKKEDCASDCNCGVDYFSLTHVPANGKPTTITNKGAFYSAEALALIRKAASGDHYYFTDIVLKCNNSMVTNNNSLHFLIN